MRHPRTPFSTRLSGNAKETELRLRSIFQWKKQRPPMWLLALVIVMTVSCGGLVSCQSSVDPIQPPHTEKEPADEVLTLTTADDRIISVELELKPTERDEDYLAVTELRVFEGETLLQSIVPAELAGYEIDGLYVLYGYNIGEPDVRDFNFDGSEDLALLSESTLSQNPAYLFFLWDEEDGQLADSFLMTGLPILDADQQQIIENMTNGLTRYYKIEDGLPVLTDTLQFPDEEYEVRIREDELTGLTLDEVGIEDDSVLIESRYPTDLSAPCEITLYAILGGDEGVLTYDWELYAYPKLLSGRLTNPERDSIVIELSNMGSNYGAADIVVLDVVDDQLVERLQFSGVMGSYIQTQDGPSLDTLKLPSLVDKWHQPEWHTAIWDGAELYARGDGYFTDTIPLGTAHLSDFDAVELTLSLRGCAHGDRLVYDQAQILAGDQLLQTIDPAGYLPEQFYDHDGFLADGYAGNGAVDVKDINFDGYPDFGLLCDDTRNERHAWFVWNEAAQQFVYFAHLGGELTVDPTVWKLEEVVWDENFNAKITNFYRISPDGTLYRGSESG